jgi:hypothetical protein
MPNLSPATIAINTIAHSLANAVSAASEFDAAVSQDLRSLLHLAACEVDRVRKANRKAASAAKRAGGKSQKSEKKATPKRARAVEAPVAAKPRGRRKASTVNGVTAH